MKASRTSSLPRMETYTDIVLIKYWNVWSDNNDNVDLAYQ